MSDPHHPEGFGVQKVVFSIANTRKTEILNVAVQLMKKKGYRGTTLQDIAKELNITEPALYYYYSNKEEILMEIINRIMRVATRGLSEIQKQDIPVENKVRKVIHMYSRLVADNEMMTVYFNNKHELSSVNWEKITHQERGFVQNLASIIEEGMEQGIFKRMNPMVATFALLGMSSWVYKWYDRDGELDIDQISDCFTDIFLKGMTNDHADQNRS